MHRRPFNILAGYSTTGIKLLKTHRIKAFFSCTARAVGVCVPCVNLVNQSLLNTAAVLAKFPEIIDMFELLHENRTCW